MQCALFVPSRFVSGGLRSTSDSAQCEKPLKGFLNSKMLMPHVFRGAFYCFLPFMNSPLSPVAPPPPAPPQPRPSPAPSCVTHSYRKCLQSCCQGCSQVQSSHQTNWVHGIEKVRKSRLSAKQTPQSWTPGAGWIHTANLSLGVEGCSSTLGFVNYTLSGPQVSKMWLLLFALLFISFKTIWKWGKKNCHRNRMVLRDPVLWQ